MQNIMGVLWFDFMAGWKCTKYKLSILKDKKISTFFFYTAQQYGLHNIFCYVPGMFLNQLVLSEEHVKSLDISLDALHI